MAFPRFLFSTLPNRKQNVLLDFVYFVLVRMSTTGRRWILCLSIHISRRRVDTKVCDAFYFITARKRNLGQGNIFTPFCHFVHREVGLPQCMMGYHPQTRCPRTRPPRHPLRPGTPPGPGTPLYQAHIPWTRHTSPGPGTPPRTRHPTPKACWEIRSTRGQYASYWNAIVFL